LNPAMKQRLVGTLVLGSLALILIPLLLDGEGVERPPLSGSIPPAPVFDTTPLPEPVRPEILADSQLPADDGAESDVVPADLADANTAGELANPEAATTEAASTATASTEEGAPSTGTVAATPQAAPPQGAGTPALDASGLPEGWVVRVGVFGEKANAERLTARLTADSYKAFIRPVGVSSGVFIGPVATQNEATGIQRQLNAEKAKYQIGDASVQRYDIAQ
jgi:DedD protein